MLKREYYLLRYRILYEEFVKCLFDKVEVVNLSIGKLKRQQVIIEEDKLTFHKLVSNISK